MIYVDEVIGNSHDLAWQSRLDGASIDYVMLDQWEAQKKRFRKQTQAGAELAVSLDRHSQLREGDVLVWNEGERIAIVAHIDLKEVMVVDLDGLLRQPSDEMVRHSIELGHAIGNQHWPAVIKDQRVYVPLTVDQKVMRSVMKTHAIEGVEIQFVPGAEVLPYLAPHESRRLFGGAQEQAHAHTLEPQEAEARP